MNSPVNLYTNGSFWTCPECGDENVSLATRLEVDINDLDPDFRDHLFEAGEFDHMLPDDDDFDEDDDDFELSGTVTLFREPITVQCGNQSCGEVFPTRVMTVAESDAARRWKDVEDNADELVGDDE